MLFKHSDIAQLDPLNCNEAISHLPDLNSNQDINGLWGLLNAMVHECNKQNTMKQTAACAAMRDIGFVVSSLRRWGIQAVSQNKNLEKAVLGLSQQTGMVPRDTVYHYTVWNSKESERRFTGTKDEGYLIQSVRKAIIDLEDGIMALQKANNFGVDHILFAEACNQAEIFIRKSIADLGITIKGVTPRVFSVEIRPYFDPIEVNGVSYVSSGGGQIPLFLIDKIVWLDDKDIHAQQYCQFVNQHLEYLPPHLTSYYNRHFSKDSWIQSIKQLQMAGGAVPPKNIESIKRIVDTLAKFRRAHLNYAQKTFIPQNAGKYDTGSAGYKVSFVEYVYNLNVSVLSEI